MICMIVISFAGQYVKWQSLAYNGLDLGIYTQVVSETSQGNFFGFTIHPHSYLGDHVEFLLLLLVPLFWIVAHPLWLLAAQSLVLALGAIPIFRLARKKLNGNWALGLSAAYLFSPFLWNANMYEFHMLAFAIPILLAALQTYITKSLKWHWLWLALALLVREDVAFVVFGIGIVAAIERRNWKWWLPTFLVSAAWFGCSIYLAGSLGTLGEYKFLKYYGWLGPDLVSIIGNFFGHPWLVLQRVLHPQALAFLLGLGLPFAYLPIFRLRWLIPILPIYLQLSLSGVAREISLEMHYVSLFLPFLWIGSIEAIHKLRSEMGKTRRGKFIQEYAGVIVSVLAVVAIYCFIVIGPIRGLAQTWYRPDTQREHEQLARDVLNIVPDTTPLATGYRFISWTATRPVLYSLHYLFIGRQQYSDESFPLDPSIQTLLIDQSDFVTYQSVYPEDNTDYKGGAQRFRDLIEERKLQLNLMVDDLLLYTNTHTTSQKELVRIGNEDQLRQSLFQTSNGLILHSWENNEGINKLQSEYVHINTHNYLTLPLSFIWSQHEITTRHNTVLLTLTRGDGAVYQKEYPIAPLWPQSEWPLDTPMITQHQFLIPTDFAQSDTQIAMDVMSIRGRLSLDTQRSIVPRYDEHDSLGHLNLGNLILPDASDTE